MQKVKLLRKRQSLWWKSSTMNSASSLCVLLTKAKKVWLKLFKLMTCEVSILSKFKIILCGWYFWNGRYCIESPANNAISKNMQSGPKLNWLDSTRCCVHDVRPTVRLYLCTSRFGLLVTPGQFQAISMKKRHSHLNVHIFFLGIIRHCLKNYPCATKVVL